jgi:hypothetical protein
MKPSSAQVANKFKLKIPTAIQLSCSSLLVRDGRKHPEFALCSAVCHFWPALRVRLGQTRYSVWNRLSGDCARCMERRSLLYGIDVRRYCFATFTSRQRRPIRRAFGEELYDLLPWFSGAKTRTARISSNTSIRRVFDKNL